jgi:hypothetical protein
MTVGRWSRHAAIARRHGVLIVFILLVTGMFATTSTFGTYQNLTNVLPSSMIRSVGSSSPAFLALRAEVRSKSVRSCKASPALQLSYF